MPSVPKTSPEPRPQSTSGTGFSMSKYLTGKANEREGRPRVSPKPVKDLKSIIIKFYDENSPKFRRDEETILKSSVEGVISALETVKEASEDQFNSHKETLRFWFGSSSPDVVTFAIDSINELYDLFTDETMILTFFNMTKDDTNYIPGLYPKSSEVGEPKHRSYRGKSKCNRSSTDGSLYIQSCRDYYENTSYTSGVFRNSHNEEYERERMGRMMRKRASCFSIDIEFSYFVPLESHMKAILLEAISSKLKMKDVIPARMPTKPSGVWIGGGTRMDCNKLAIRNPEMTIFNSYSLLYFIIDFVSPLVPDY
ncbi:MAG: hypothetical protein KAH18_05555 [Psychromonas sp.]|nr:hypothetical protein [Psychromonas sp.]